MEHFEVRNGGRTIVFDGTRLARASSRHGESLRWVEFGIYLTAGGKYIFERVGRSRVFHGVGDCSTVAHNKLRFDPENQALNDEHEPCGECRPDEDRDDLIVERPRYYAQVCESPGEVIAACHMQKRGGAPYLTNVTRRLIEQAADVDARMDDAYRVQYVV